MEDVVVKNVQMKGLSFEGTRPSWDVIVTVGVSSPFGEFDLEVPVEAATLDAAVDEAMRSIYQWLGDFSKAVTTALKP